MNITSILQRANILGSEGSTNEGWTTWILLGLIGVFVIVFMIVGPRLRGKKRNQMINDMHSNIVPGCTVKTLGGIIGKVVSIRELSPLDKEVVIETGVDGDGKVKSTFTFDFQYILTILTLADGTKYVPIYNQIGRKNTAQSADTTTDNIQPFDASGVNTDTTSSIQPLEASDTTQDSTEDK
jgi:preprotein translocase YajC subunit